MENTLEKTKLDRALGLTSTFCIVTGAVIGSGIFLVASDISKVLPNPQWAYAVWIIAGFVSFLGGLIFAELGTRFPDAGGQYVYLKNAFHPVLGFLFGWTLALVIQAGSIAAVAIAFAIFFNRAVAFDISQPLLASVVVVAMTLLNFFGIRKGAAVLDAITGVKILAILALAAIGLTFPASGGAAEVGSSLGGFPTFSSLGVALIAAFWSFDGWNNLGFVAGEVKNPRRNIPMGMGLGILTITTLYIFANMTYFKVLSPSEISASSFVAADAVSRILGTHGVSIAALFVSLSALGCLNAMVLSGARVIYAMASDGKLPQILGKLNPKTRSPNAALFVQGVWTLVLVWSGRYDQLFTYVVFAAFLFYGLSGVALFRLRKKPVPEGREVYQVPFYPWLPGLYVVFTFLFTLNALIEKPQESLAGLTLVLLGIPAYWYFTRRSLRLQQRSLADV